jgi:hypothetical protein
VNGAGNSGNDSIIFNDQNHTLSETWTFADNLINRTGLPWSLDYTLGIENLIVNAGVGNDVVNVTARSPAATTRFEAAAERHHPHQPVRSRRRQRFGACTCRRWRRRQRLGSGRSAHRERPEHGV